MKYLAAYALLALSGNNNICINLIIKPLLTSREYLVMLKSKLMMLILIDFLNLSKENLFINLLLKEPNKLALQGQLLLQDQHQKQLK